MRLYYGTIPAVIDDLRLQFFLTIFPHFCSDCEAKVIDVFSTLWKSSTKSNKQKKLTDFPLIKMEICYKSNQTSF